MSVVCSVFIFIGSWWEGNVADVENPMRNNRMSDSECVCVRL